MSWRDDLLDATFRAVPFKVRAMEHSTGRRLAVHEYPGAEEPFVEDLGAQPKRFSIDAFVIGDDYLEKRDRLLDALNKPGRGGVLIHPSFRIIPCAVENITLSESNDELGMARITISFIRVGEEIQRQATPFRSGQIGEQADELRAASGDAAEETIQSENVPSSVVDATSDALREVGRTLASLDVLDGPSQDLAQLQSQVQNIIAEASSLAQSPPVLVAQVQQAINGILEGSATAIGSLNAYEVLLGLESSPKGGESVAAKLADQNTQATIQLARETAAAGAVEAASRIEWEYYGQAIGARTDLAALLEGVAEQSSDSVYPVLQALRASLFESVPPPNEDLPRLEVATLGVAMPSLVLAYDRYDDLGRESEILDRNRVRHPGFVPGGVPLELLSE